MNASRSYLRGDRGVVTHWIGRHRTGPPRSIVVHLPAGGPATGTLLFHHGFQARAGYHGVLLRHLSSHGWAVIAPQMYQPGLVSALGRPTIGSEVDTATALLDWLIDRGPGAGIPVARPFVLAGHSRGGDVAWRLAARRRPAVDAVVGFDPVDVGATPLLRQASELAALELGVPALVVGLGAASPCAPRRAGHLAFASATLGATHVVVPGAGHGDVLDDLPAGAARRICGGSGSIPAIRAAAGGLAAGFLGSAIGGHHVDIEQLAAAAPTAVTVVRTGTTWAG